jgi:phosphoserine aminotransferase
VEHYLREAWQEGILSMPHRSQRFRDMVQQLEEDLKTVLGVPESYQMVLLGSATECWQVFTTGLCEWSSAHLFSGSFGQRWWHYNRQQQAASGVQFDAVGTNTPRIYRSKRSPADTLCLTYTETSNGAQLSRPFIEGAIAHYREAATGGPPLQVLVDATSALGGVPLPFSVADSWFASVQKCLGCPAGQAVGFLSPAAVQKAQTQPEQARTYHDLRTVIQQAQQHMTTHTPNVLGIYLLSRVARQLRETPPEYDRLAQQATQYYTVLDEHPLLKPLVPLPENRSQTVIAIASEPEYIRRLEQAFLQAGLEPSKGYGPWKETSLRLANFPQLSANVFQRAITVLKKFN